MQDDELLKQKYTMKGPKMDKVSKVMHEFKKGKLHGGSKKGPKVKSKRQALAIALSEQRKADAGGYKK